MKRFTLIGLICIVLSSCTASTSKRVKPSTPSIRKVMNSWKGSHISEVIRSWSPYSQVAEDGIGGQIYIWQLQEQRLIPQRPPIPPPPPASGRDTVPGILADITRWKLQRESTIMYTTINITRSRMFYARPNGIIYHWLIKTN